ncbi:hypothetical protein OHA72_50415 [Dactylosporangium sp. NBC_01737]|uniref:hypothetical protein n=1 Tax=Dactylosporangium sp. NBC_01737 TaxID=2975959 RepID=UPI002E11372D|nr:hypothetical protein OHA72_50415 [Dactylosporangium sp. NBC_01737]
MTAAVVVSLFALGVSGIVALRQIAQFHRVNHFSVIAQLLGEFRRAEFHERYDYVVNKLGSDHAPDLGLLNLPEPARTNVMDIAFYFQEFASLRAFGILHESENLGNLYRRTIEVWDAIEPYVLVERGRSQNRANEHTLALLQQYATRLKALRSRKKLPGLDAA